MTDRVADARDYLADDLDMQGDDADDDWFYELADHLRSLSPQNPLCTRLAIGLQPFLMDDDRIECTMYPLGEAVTYMDTHPTKIDFDTYLIGLIEAIEADHARWQAHIRKVGDHASWTLESGPPTI